MVLISHHQRDAEGFENKNVQLKVKGQGVAGGRIGSKLTSEPKTLK